MDTDYIIYIIIGIGILFFIFTLVLVYKDANQSEEVRKSREEYERQLGHYSRNIYAAGYQAKQELNKEKRLNEQAEKKIERLGK